MHIMTDRKTKAELLIEALMLKEKKSKKKQSTTGNHIQEVLQL